MNYLLGGFCLGWAAISFVSAWRANYIKDYDVGRHKETLFMGFLITAAICFK